MASSCALSDPYINPYTSFVADLKKLSIGQTPARPTMTLWTRQFKPSPSSGKLRRMQLLTSIIIRSLQHRPEQLTLFAQDLERVDIYEKARLQIEAGYCRIATQVSFRRRRLTLDLANSASLSKRKA